MARTVFIKAEEVAQELEISKALAYRMIHRWNDELKAKGYTTVTGRVSRQYFEEQRKEPGILLFILKIGKEFVRRSLSVVLKQKKKHLHGKDNFLCRRQQI